MVASLGLGYTAPVEGFFLTLQVEEEADDVVGCRDQEVRPGTGPGLVVVQVCIRDD
jgi:hypothetical protein